MIAFLTELLVAHGVLVVVVVSLLVRVGVPIPAAPVLVVAGALTVSGGLSGPALLAGAVVATVAGDAVWFVAGRRYGYRVLRLLCRISLSPDSCVRQSEGMISRWGGASLVAAKFVPGVSVVAAPMAGAMGMAWSRFVAFDALAGALWALVFAGLGALFSTQVQRLLDGLATAGAWAGVALVVALAGFVVSRWWRRRRVLDDGAMPRISIDELQALIDAAPTLDAGPVLIDVRSSANAQIDPRRIPGALLVELSDIARHAQHLPRDREIVLHCNCPNEASAARAARLLAERGVTRVRPLAGGLEGWVASGRPLANLEPQAFDVVPA
jgi:membrane protein DedA with SNARE-associated domain/rhodanese-related sulfurtransferase